MEISQANDRDNEPTHHEESWTVAISSRKRKVTPFASGRKTESLEKKNNGFCSAAQHICTPSRAACQPTVYVSSFEHSIGLRTHHKVAILVALFAQMV